MHILKWKKSRTLNVPMKNIGCQTVLPLLPRTVEIFSRKRLFKWKDSSLSVFYQVDSQL